jgi:hypothetical protein
MAEKYELVLTKCILVKSVIKQHTKIKIIIYFCLIKDNDTI